MLVGDVPHLEPAHEGLLVLRIRQADQELGLLVRELEQEEPSFSQKSTFPQQSIFYPLFLNEDGRILKNSHSKLHYRFRRYSTLLKSVLLESQYQQSYDSFPDFLRPKFEEDRHKDS